MKALDTSVLIRFLASGRENDLYLSDILIAHSAKFSGCERVLTFDKKASNYGLFELVV